MHSNEGAKEVNRTMQYLEHLDFKRKKIQCFKSLIGHFTLQDQYQSAQAIFVSNLPTYISDTSDFHRARIAKIHQHLQSGQFSIQQNDNSLANKFMQSRRNQECQRKERKKLP